VIPLSLEIKERKITKHIRKIKNRKGKVKKYVQYGLTLPKDFVEKHKVDKLYLVADQIWIGVTEEKLLDVLKELPKLQKLIKQKTTQEGSNT